MTLFLIQTGICKMILCLSIFKGDFLVAYLPLPQEKVFPLRLSISPYRIPERLLGVLHKYNNRKPRAAEYQNWPWVLCASSGSAMPLYFERLTVPSLKALWPLGEGYKKGAHAPISDIFQLIRNHRPAPFSHNAKRLLPPIES